MHKDAQKVNLVHKKSFREGRKLFCEARI